MKKITFILALFLVGLNVSAKTTHNTTTPFNYGESFIFVERGVEFAVYPNGEFDFYYNPQFARTSIRNISNPGHNISYNSGYNYDTYVQYDDYGAVIQIENVPVYYDYYGRISRAGNVDIAYNSHGNVARIGDMFVYYNAFDRPVKYAGYINSYNTRYINRPWHKYYMRPYQDYRVVYYQPYRAYYEPTRLDYVTYVNNYNSYYYSNGRRDQFYRPGQSIAYNYGRRTAEQRNLNSHYAYNESRNEIKTNSENARSNQNTIRTQSNNNTYSTSGRRESSIIEKHEAAVRSTRGASAVDNRNSTVGKSASSNSSSSRGRVSQPVIERNTTPVTRSSTSTPTREVVPARSTSTRQPAEVRREREVSRSNQSGTSSGSTVKSETRSSRGRD